jgi:hypothetical protein
MDELDLAAKVIQLARERCFDLKAVDHNEAQMPFDGKVFSRSTKYGIISKEMALLSHQETMFECKFKVHGLCQSKCLERAAEAKTR